MEGSTSSFPLYPDNDTTKPPMATAQVSTDGVTITFNDNVNNLQKVKDGEPLGGRTSSTDDFTALDGADEDFLS